MGDALVSVVVPAANEDGFIGACLDSVLAQSYESLQLIVVDGASTDRTADVVRARAEEDTRVELIQHDRRNIPSSLNLGLKAARGRWLVRIDAHCTVPPDYIEVAVRGLQDGWAGVGGRKDGVGRTAAGKAIAVAMGSRLGVGGSTYHHGTVRQEVEHLPFGAYPTCLLRELDGWDERLVANEDFELDHRLRAQGHRLLFDPSMTIAWHCRQSLGDLFRQYRRYGRGKADVALLHPGSLRPRHVAPPVFVVFLAGVAVVGHRHPGRAIALVAPYVVAILGESVRLAPRLDSGDQRVRVPAALVAMHVGWGLGFWSGARDHLTRTARRWGPRGRGR
jgi:succinoglycan biosynthesis protein ExoA